LRRLPVAVLGGLAGAVAGCLCALVALGVILVLVAMPWKSGATPAPTTEATQAAMPAVRWTPVASEAQEATFTVTMRPMSTPTFPPASSHTPSATSAPSASASTTEQSPTPAPSPDADLARVVGIADGDSIEVEIEGQVYGLRYIGIDSPEPDQPGWWEAMEANRRLVEGQSVRLEKDVSETDQYGRLLRYVYVGNLLVNAELVRQGYAAAVVFPPDVGYADLFAQLENEAQLEGRGLWAATPVTRRGTSWDCVGNIYNCDGFSSCEEVKSYWETCPGDPSRLDGDHDGRPCESLCR